MRGRTALQALEVSNYLLFSGEHNSHRPNTMTHQRHQANTCNLGASRVRCAMYLSTDRHLQLPGISDLLTFKLPSRRIRPLGLIDKHIGGSMVERKIKSYGLFGTLDFIDKTYPADVQSKIKSNVPDKVLQFVSTSNRPPWAPPEYSCYFWKQIAELAESEQDAISKLEACGACMGEYATNTYLRLLLKVVNMKIMASKAPSQWSKDANFGKLSTDISDIDSGKVLFHYDEMNDYPYFGPICKGWFMFSFGVMGLKDFDVSLVDWSMAEPDPGKLTFEVTWTP